MLQDIVSTSNQQRLKKCFITFLFLYKTDKPKL